MHFPEQERAEKNRPIKQHAMYKCDSYFLLIKIQCVFLILKRRALFELQNRPHIRTHIAYHFGSFDVNFFSVCLRNVYMYRIEMSIFAFGNFNSLDKHRARLHTN